MNDLGPASIIERDTQHHSSVMGGYGHTMGDLFLNVGSQSVDLSDRLKANIVSMGLLELALQISLEHLHEPGDLSFRTLPIFGRESIKSYRRNFEPRACIHDSSNGACPFTVAKDPRLSATLRPPPVSVHDHRDVAGKTSEIDA